MMMKSEKTQLDVVKKWVNGFNAVPTLGIAKLMNVEPDDWREVTRPVVGKRVYAYDSGVDEGTVAKVDYETGWCEIDLDTGSLARYHENRIEVQYDDGIPMYGDMWSFGERCYDFWLEEKTVSQ